MVLRSNVMMIRILEIASTLSGGIGQHVTVTDGGKVRIEIQSWASRQPPEFTWQTLAM